MEYTEISTIASPVHRVRISSHTQEIENGVNRNNSSTPCQVCIDVTFLGNSSTISVNDSLDFLIFQNYYTSSITLLQLSLSNSKYIPILENKLLMASSYCDEGSQSWFSIPFSEFDAKFMRGRPIRIIMNQPGNMWKLFEIRNVKVLRKVADATVKELDSNFGLSATEMKGSFCEMMKNDYQVFVTAMKDQILAKDSPSNESSQRFKNSTKKKDKKKPDMKMGSLN